MKRTDLYFIALLIGIVLLIFHPLFYTRYLYTDEAVQLWMYRRGSGFQMFVNQGRYITEKLFQWLFGSINTIHEITYLRLFSLFGWIACIPVWYYIINKVIAKEGLARLLAGFSLVYLIAMPPFALFVSWTSVMELFIANTAGLISGYMLYSGIGYRGHTIHITRWKFFLSLAIGCISLFTYQNGFGCFLLPFLLHLIAGSRISKVVVIGVGVYLLTQIVYYFLFKVNLSFSQVSPSERVGLHINVGNKLPFFLARPLNSSFHFTGLFNENSIAGAIVYGILAITFFILALIQNKGLTNGGKLKFFGGLFCLLGLIYLPSLLVKENYASNRTLFALNLAVFFMVAHVLLAAIQQRHIKRTVVIVLSCLFVINAWYNFNKQYLQPVAEEYQMVRNFLETNYRTGMDTIYFIRPREDFFVRKYGITRSWDEFGVPSTFFEWTPPFLVRQIIFEKTGDRQEAEKIVIKNWPNRDSLSKTAAMPTGNRLLVDAEKIMSTP